MMPGFRLLAGCGLALIAAPALAERLVVPPSPGFVVGHAARQGGNSLTELVPRGETVQRFTRMITLQRLAGLGRVPPPAFVAEFAKRYMAGCPRSTAMAVTMGRDGGVRIDCPRHPNTGRMETVFARALKTGPDMYVAQITYTILPTGRDGTWARDYLGDVAVVR